MPDVFTPAQRSKVMSRIKSRGNRETELLFASLLRKNGISGWRRHLPLTGRPDFTFKRNRVVVFIDGCFWHCCPKCGNMPVNNAVFWKKKLGGNQRRDRQVNHFLRANGWRVLRIWEHELRNPDAVLKRLVAALMSD
ncbi:MAG: very short patch repair endonuclease [Terriglobales bacterium]